MENCLKGSEAIYGFCAWLTSRKEKTIMSASNDAAIIVDMIEEFCDLNKLPEARDNYTDYLILPKK